MSEQSNQKYIKTIVNLLAMPKPKFVSENKFDQKGKLIMIPSSSGEKIAIKLTKAKNPLPGNPVLLFTHGDGETIDDYYYYQSYLCKYGMSFCIMDHRGSGYAEGQYQTSGIRETDDCLTVINYLKENGFTKISFFGRSLGGICGIYVASQLPDLVCIALDSPVIDIEKYVIYVMTKFYHLSPEKVKELYSISCEKVKEKTGIDFSNIQQPFQVAEKICQPLIIMHGKSDVHVPISNSEELMQLVKSDVKKFVPFNGTHVSFRHKYFLELFVFILQQNGVEITEFTEDDENEDDEEEEN